LTMVLLTIINKNLLFDAVSIKKLNLCVNNNHWN